MNNFYLNADGATCFSGPLFIAAWQAGIKNSQRAGSQVKNLWNSFNADRKLLDKHYMNNPESLQAYLASFVLPNCERVFSILTSSQSQSKLLQLVQDRTTPIRILDFGCGPLSASAGFLAACEFTLRNTKVKTPLVFEFICVERSEKAFLAGKNLIEQSLTHAENVTFTLFSSLEKVSGKFDVALCSNIFNEIPEKHRFITAEKVAEKITEKGILLILEPGQDIHSKQLGLIRDKLLAPAESIPPETSSSSMRVMAPCTHNKKCPLSAASNRTDWCWFQNRWQMPEALAHIDKFSKLDHSELNFSFVLFTKEPPAPSQAFARVVSAPIRITPANPENFTRTALFAEKNSANGCDPLLIKRLFDEKKPLDKIILCTKNGELESGFTTVDNMEWNRGSLLSKNYDLKTRAMERFELNDKLGE